jgi:hypothetical protein
MVGVTPIIPNAKGAGGTVGSAAFPNRKEALSTIAKVLVIIASQNYLLTFCATPQKCWKSLADQPGKGAMMKNIDDMQNFGKDNMDATMKSFGAVSKGVQAIAVEVADYSKKSFEESSAAMEKLFGAKSFDKAIEVQSDYVRSAYESFVAEATKLGELYADLARESYKPFETYLAKVSTAK